MLTLGFFYGSHLASLFFYEKVINSFIYIFDAYGKQGSCVCN